jgi:acylphosphatase
LDRVTDPAGDEARAERPATVRLEAVVQGRVHGVGFRVHVRRAARELGLLGWVANEPGARVRCVAEGPRPNLERLLAILREGPTGARVDDVHVDWRPPTGEFAGFDVRSGWHSGD